MNPKHCKRKKTFNTPGHAHFITFSCYQRLPLLKRDQACGWAFGAIEKARRRLDYSVYGYVVMPEHVHLLVMANSVEYKVQRLLYAIKRPVSWQAKQGLIEKGRQDWLDRLTVVKNRKQVFRFWDQGGGFDSNITQERTLKSIIDYMHNNPVRRGLVDRAEDWAWSSCRYWMGEDDVPLSMDPLDV